MSMLPFTVDSRGPPNARVATGVPAWAPSSVKLVRLTLLITTFSLYIPAQTWIMSPDVDAATAAPMLL